MDIHVKTSLMCMSILSYGFFNLEQRVDAMEFKLLSLLVILSV